MRMQFDIDGRIYLYHSSGITAEIKVAEHKVRSQPIYIILMESGSIETQTSIYLNMFTVLHFKYASCIS